MKKKYSKPIVIIESFQLLEHIAYCAVGSKTTVTYRDPSECSYSDDNLAVFNAGVIGCENEYDPEIFTGGLEEFLAFVQNTTEGIECYNAFSNGATFAS